MAVSPMITADLNRMKNKMFRATINQTTQKSDNQFYLFVAGLIIFGVIAGFGWIKLRYGFNFIDEGYHMTKSWRLTVGDHFLDDQYQAIMMPYTIINSLIFRINPNITLLGFRQLQFILTLSTLFFFSAAIYNANKEYWYLPFIFSVFAFTGLDPVGIASNLNYYTYPHLFLTLSLACLIIGFQLDNKLSRRAMFLFSGFFLWLINVSLLHLGVIILFPIILYSLSRILRFKYFYFDFKDCLLLSTPFLLGWFCFILVYQETFFTTIFKSLHFFLSVSTYSAEALTRFHILPFVYVVTATLFLIVYIISLIKLPLKASFVFFPALSLLIYTIMDTSFFGFIQPYYYGWFGRPMWFASFLIGFYIIFWTGLLKKILLKQNINRIEEFLVILLIPVTLLSVVSTVFSTIGPLNILYSSIPGIAGLTIYFLNCPGNKLKSLFFKLVLIIVILIPVYCSAIKQDWEFTNFDVHPSQMDATIEKGFGKGIKTNVLYAKLYEWIGKNAEVFAEPNDYLLSYVASPMTNMITKLRPSLDDTYITMDIPASHCQRAIQSMESKGRNPKIAFIFERMPILCPAPTKKGAVTFFGKQLDFPSSLDPISSYVKKNMTPASEFNISNDNIIRCYVDKQRFAKESLSADIKQTNKSIAELKEKINQQPENGLLYYKLGLIYEQDNNRKKAMHAYQKSLALQPDSFLALSRMAMLQIKKKNYSDAISLLSGPMLRLQPDNTVIYYNIACLYALQNDQDNAIGWLRTALEKGYDNLEKIRIDPDLENIRNSTYYQTFIKNNE